MDDRMRLLAAPAPADALVASAGVAPERCTDEEFQDLLAGGSGRGRPGRATRGLSNGVYPLFHGRFGLPGDRGHRRRTHRHGSLAAPSRAEDAAETALARRTRSRHRPLSKRGWRVNIDRRLTCVEALRRLDDYLDGELARLDAGRVEQHLEVCAACAKEFGFERTLIDQLRGKLRDVQMPPQVRGRIM